MPSESRSMPGLFLNLPSRPRPERTRCFLLRVCHVKQNGQAQIRSPSKISGLTYPDNLAAPTNVRASGWHYRLLNARSGRILRAGRKVAKRGKKRNDTNAKSPQRQVASRAPQPNCALVNNRLFVSRRFAKLRVFRPTAESIFHTCQVRRMLDRYAGNFLPDSTLHYR